MQISNIKPSLSPALSLQSDVSSASDDYNPTHMSSSLSSTEYATFHLHTCIESNELLFTGVVIALLLLTAPFYADAVSVSRASRAGFALTSSCAAAAFAFVANRAAVTSAAAASTAAAAALSQVVVPPLAMFALCVVGVLLGIAGVRPHGGGGGAGGGGSKQLPMFVVKDVGEDGDVTDDEHAKQVRLWC